MFTRFSRAGAPALAAALTTAAFMTVQSGSAAAADTWKRIATQDVDLSRGNDRIDLKSAKGTYKALRLYARRARIVLSNVRVGYGNGTSFDEARRINLLPGERTRPINRQDKGRFVNYVDLTYNPSTGNRETSRLEVWGLQSDAGAQRERAIDKIRDKVSDIKDKVQDRVADIKDKMSGDTTSGAAAAGSITDTGSVFFGIKSVGFGVDRDVVTVGREIGKFDKIRLRVRDNDIYLREVKVVYGNGQPDVIAYEGEVKADSRTRWLPLKGDRFIKEIEMTYRSKPNFNGRARVEVYGQFAEGWLAPQGGGTKYNRGWVFLGGQSPLIFSIKKGLIYEKDIVEVGRNKGGFKSVRVDVRNRDITLREMTVVYGDGTIDIIPVKKKVAAGESFGPVDLQGKGRVIKEIQVRYRTRIFGSQSSSDADGGDRYAFVEFWGRH